MKKIYALLAMLFLTYTHPAFSQNNQDNTIDYSEYINKTINKPNYYTFQDYSKEGSVDLLTGKFGLDINFHQIETEYLNIPITFQYSTGGVQLDDISNEVGIDWHLVAGGSITRTIHDVADEMGSTIWSNKRFCDNLGNFLGTGGDVGYTNYDINMMKTIGTGYGAYRGSANATIGSWFTNFFPKRRFDNGYSEIGSLVEIKRFETWPESDELSNPSFNLDTEPDIFRCAIGDLNFSFILKRKPSYFNIDGTVSPGGGALYFEAVPIDEIGIKIKYYISSALFHDRRKNYSPNQQKRDVDEFVISKFEITDKRGVIYTFENFDFIDADSIEEFFNNFFGENNMRIFQWKTYNTTTNNWKITSIQLPNNKTINFQYIPNEYLYQKQVPRMHDGEYNNLKYNLSPALPTYAINRLDTHIEGHSISEISYDNQRVKFHYTNYRPDMKTGGFNLNRIELWNKDQRLIKSFNLSKTFSYSDLDGGHEDYRMFLTGVEDSRTEKTYSFSYDNIDALPPRSYVQYQDIFGYYLGPQAIANNYPSFPTIYIDPNDTNGNKISYDIPNVPYYTVNSGSNRSVKLNHPKTGTLKKITFPTGGELEVVFENNTYFDPKLQNKKALGPGVRTKELKYYSGGGQLAKKTEYSYDNFNDATASSGTLLYKPSLAYISNWNLNNQYDRKTEIENNTYDFYNANSRLNYYSYYHFDRHYSKEKLSQSGLNDHSIYAKMVKLSTHGIGNRMDFKGREIIYPNVTEKLVNIENPNLSYYTKFYFNNVDNRGKVNSITGPSDEPNIYAAGTESTSYSNFSPFYARTTGTGYMKTAAGFIERSGYDIYPFPERNFYDTTENQLFGKLLKKEYFDNTNTKKYTEIYSYGQIVKNDSINSGNLLKSIKTDFLKMHLYDSNDATKEFKKYHKLLSSGSSITQTDIQNYHGLYLFSVKPIKYNSKIFLEHKTVTTHFGTGDIVEQYDYNYSNNPYGNLSLEYFSNSKGEQFEKYYLYPEANSNKPWLSQMLTKNILIPYKTGTRKTTNQENINENEYAYKTWQNGSVMLEHISQRRDELNPEIKIRVNKRDDRGNILEYQKENGIPISLIWGYGNTQLVAKLENISYANIPGNLITTIQNATDSSISTALNGLRASVDINMQKAMITTYVYEPLIGISNITDPKGETAFFEYDSSGRLKRVKDSQGNILSENQYHYWIQN
ncbi:YD repeat-containing protein [Flavobacterium sp. 28YEA47A]|uniref:hypothetical protein n=1 Tax=Flavobacterium sp. 28YEA47A TaxID=3156276 RepID=UPI0035152010